MKINANPYEMMKIDPIENVMDDGLQEGVPAPEPVKNEEPKRDEYVPGSISPDTDIYSTAYDAKGLPVDAILPVEASHTDNALLKGRETLGDKQN